MNRKTWVWVIFSFVIYLASCAKQPAPKVIVEGTQSVKKDQWHPVYFRLQNRVRVRVHLTVQDGPAIDAYVMSKANFNKWRGDPEIEEGPPPQSFSHYKNLGLEGILRTFISVTETLEAGAYYLVLDNTARGRAIPPIQIKNDTAIIHYKILMWPVL